MKVTIERNGRKHGGNEGERERSAASQTLWQPVKAFWKTAVAAMLVMYVSVGRIITGTLFFTAASALAAGVYGVWSAAASFGGGTGGALLGLGCGIAALGLAAPAFKLGVKFHGGVQHTVRSLKADNHRQGGEYA